MILVVIFSLFFFFLEYIKCTCIWTSRRHCECSDRFRMLLYFLSPYSAVLHKRFQIFPSPPFIFSLVISCLPCASGNLCASHRDTSGILRCSRPHRWLGRNLSGIHPFSLTCSRKQCSRCGWWWCLLLLGGRRWFGLGGRMLAWIWSRGNNGCVGCWVG